MPLCLLILFCGVLAAQDVSRIKPLPPPGIAVSTEDEQALRAGLSALQSKLHLLKDNPHAPDVEIFAKAVRFALEDHEFFRQEQVFRAKELLRIGMERADQLARGDAPWTRETGLVVRAYVSKIDGSVQPYGLVVPPGYSPERPRKWRVDAWFHGRSDTLNEIDFLWARLHDAGEFTPEDTIVLHLYGRYCNASQFAGEVDFFEALDDVRKNYGVDENRILVRGFSMGGASVWHIAAHHAGDFAAAQPGAGFAETLDYQKHRYTPTWFEERLLHFTNATDYALNFFQLPVIAYNGDQDPQAQAADIMARNMAEYGMTLARIYGRGAGHKYTPEAKQEIEARIDEIAAAGRDPSPKQIRFETWTLKYNRMRWVTVDAMEREYERARVEADITDDHTIRVKTMNVDALSFDFGPGSPILNPATKIDLIIDGERLAAPGPLTDRSWTAHLMKADPPKERSRRSRSRKVARQWTLGEQDSSGLRKVHDLQGPIDDAFMEPFLMVHPTGAPINPAVAKWTQAEEERAIREWRRIFRGDAPVKNDSAVTSEDIATRNLVLWGDPSSNKVLADIADKLPVHWTADAITIGARRFPAESDVPVLIYPNPLNPKRYVVINSGHTFRESSYATNSMQVPELPDYAVIDISAPPGPKWAGKIEAAGFFGEKWELLENDGQ